MIEKESVFPLLSLSQILEGSHHTHTKRQSVFFGFSPLSPSLGKNTMEVKDILLGKVSVLSGVFGC